MHDGKAEPLRLRDAEPFDLLAANLDVPASGRTSPDAIPISVDLPAPFSPSSAWTSPAKAVNETSLTATTPPKRFQTLVKRNPIGVASDFGNDCDHSFDRGHVHFLPRSLS